MRVLADGADGLSNLVAAAAGKPTARVLDWFHISMRLQPIEQMSSKIAMAAGAMHNLAATLYALGDVAGARKLQEQVRAARRRLLGEEHPDTLTAMNNLAEMLYAQGDVAGARKLQEQVVAASRKLP